MKTPKFETINGQLCRMVEPTPELILNEAKTGWFCKLSNGEFKIIDAMLSLGGLPWIVYEIGGLRYLNNGRQISNDRSLDVVTCYYPVVEGSAEWAWYQGCILKNQIWNDLIKELITIYPCHTHDIQTNIILGQPMKSWKDDYRGWIDQCKKYAMLTGWQLYEPEPAKEPEIVAHKQHANCLVCGKEIEGLLDGHATVSIKRYSISSLYESTYSHYCGKCFLELGFDATERELRNRQQPIAEPEPEPQPAKEPIANCDNCKHICTNSNIDYCHMYEPQPAYAVGDWVSDGVTQGRITYMEDGIIDVTVNNGNIYTIEKCNLRKLKPSEVVVDFGNGIFGTIEPSIHPTWINVRKKSDWNTIASIYVPNLDEPIQTLVKELLEKQKEEKNV